MMPLCHLDHLPWLPYMAQIEDGDINLKPQYQRDYVWDEAKACKLVETVFQVRITCLGQPWWTGAGQAGQPWALMAVPSTLSGG